MVYLTATGLPLYVVDSNLCCLLTVFIGFAIERVAYKPLRSAPRMSIMISAIGVSYLLQNLALYVTGGLSQAVYPGHSAWLSLIRVTLFGVTLPTKVVTLITPVLTIAAGDRRWCC